MKRQVIAYLHTHWDREWYRSHQEFNLRLIEVVDEIISELQNSNIPCFYFDGQTDAIETYLKFRPEKEKIIKKFIKDKKLFIGPFMASADSFLTSGFLLIKNFMFGMNYAKKMGCNDFIGYLADTFGHSEKISEILKYLNIKNAILWRGTPNIQADFKFNGLNTTRLVRGYFFDTFHGKYDIKSIENELDKISEYALSDAILLPIGADHLKVLSNSGQKIDDFNRKSTKYCIKIDSPFSYIKQAKFGKNFEGEFLNNVSTYILQSVYSAKVSQKTKNRICEWRLSRIADVLQAFSKNDYRTSLDFAYKTLIKNHAHDSLYGCSIDEVQKEVDVRFEKVLQVTDGIIKRIERDIKKEYGGNSLKLCVLNLSNFKKSGIVTFKTHKKIKGLEIISKNKGFPDDILYDTGKIPITEDYTNIYEYVMKIKDMKPFSKNVIEINNEKGNVKINLDSIENDFIKIFVENHKINVLNKKTGEVYFDFVNLKDTKDLGDSYNFAPLNEGNILNILKTKVLLTNSLLSTLEVYFKNIKLFITLKDGCDFAEFKVEINNKKKNHKLQAQFNLKNNVKETIAEDTFGTIKREHDFNYSLLDNIPIERPKEAKTNCYPMQRFVWAQGVGVSTIGLLEYEIYKNTLSIPLLRAFGVISNPKNPARSVPAGPPIETYEAQEIGISNVSFAISFKESANQMFDVSENLYGADVSFLVNSDKESEKTLMNIPSSHMLYGLKDNKTAILYDMKNKKIRDFKI